MPRQLRDKEALPSLLHMGLFEDKWHLSEMVRFICFVICKGLNLQWDNSPQLEEVKVFIKIKKNPKKPLNF